MVLLVDVAYTWIDPRIKLGKSSGWWVWETLIL
jgi:hypothetical protein